MRLLNGRVIFENIHIKGFTEREFVKDATSSFIPNPLSLKEFKEHWPLIKTKESYTKELLNELALYNDLKFQIKEEDMVSEIKWLENFEEDEYQVQAVIEMLNRYRLAIFFDTGTGKTIIAANYLYNRLYDKKNWNVLIVTKAGVVKQYEFDLKSLPNDIKENNNIVVTSYGKAYNYKGTDWDIVILDESHSAKNKSALTYEDMKSLTNEFTPYVFLMTATPQDKTKYEIIVQLSILSDRFLNRKGANAFKERYFVLDDYGKPTKEYREHIHELNDMISGITIKARAEDVLDIPPIYTHTLTKPNSKEYKDMLYRRCVQIDGIPFVADSSPKHRTYLRQIANGFIYEDYITNPEEDVLDWKVSKKTHRINNEKQELLRTLLVDGYTYKDTNGIINHMPPPETAIIFTYFDEDNRIVEELLDSLCLRYKSALKVSSKKRDQLVQEFKDGEYDYLIIKAASASAGLNLQRCNNVIWWTLPQEWIYFKQGRGRVHRRGQVKIQHEFVLLNSSIDKDIYKMVAIQKKSYTDSSFSLFLDMSQKNKGEIL